MRYVLYMVGFWIFLVMNVTVSSSAERPQRVKNEKATAAPAVTAPVILSIIPAQAEPGARVMIFGSAFGENVSAYLGSVEIPAKVVEGARLEFIVPPELEAGLYALYLRRGDGVTGKTYNFTVLPLHPVLTALSLDRISSCAQGKERDVVAQGRNFGESSLLLFDGAVINSTVVSNAVISFAVPQIAGGLHQVQVKNSPDNASVPMALTIETRPEIAQVEIGKAFVNYYELNISGKNFHQNSSVYIDGQQIGGRGGQDATERERLIYIDCTKLVYLRYPYSPVNKDFRIQVVNPGGEGSQVVQMSAP